MTDDENFGKCIMRDNADENSEEKSNAWYTHLLVDAENNSDYILCKKNNKSINLYILLWFLLKNWKFFNNSFEIVNKKNLTKKT